MMTVMLEVSHSVGVRYIPSPKNKDLMKKVYWVLIEHGRWTRSVPMDNDGEEIELRMVEAESIPKIAEDKPKQVYNLVATVLVTLPINTHQDFGAR